MRKLANISEGLRFLSVGLTVVLVLQGLMPEVAAQQAQPGPEPKLKIIVLEGEGAINNIRQRTAREPIVEVQDENNRPVAGAMVLFTLPDNGPSGTFANGSKTYMTTTDPQGKAIAKGLKPNKTEGQFQIAVQVTAQSLTASAVIAQSNVTGAAAAAAAGGVSAKLIAILAIAGGAAAAGIVAATRGSSSATGVPATTISPGTPTVGPPR
jgi:hypothetical protein